MKRNLGLRSSSKDEEMMETKEGGGNVHKRHVYSQTTVSVGKVKAKQSKQGARVKQEERNVSQSKQGARVKEERNVNVSKPAEGFDDDDSVFDKSISGISAASEAAANAADAAYLAAEAKLLDEVDLTDFSEDLLAYEEAESIRSSSSSSLASSSLSSSSLSSSSSSAPSSPVSRMSLLEEQLRARNRHLNPRYSHSLGEITRGFNLANDCMKLARARQAECKSPQVARTCERLLSSPPSIQRYGSDSFLTKLDIVPPEARGRIAEWAREQDAGYSASSSASSSAYSSASASASFSAATAWTAPVNALSYKDCCTELPKELQDALEALQMAFPGHTLDGVRLMSVGDSTSPDPRAHFSSLGIPVPRGLLHPDIPLVGVISIDEGCQVYVGHHGRMLLPPGTLWLGAGDCKFAISTSDLPIKLLQFYLTTWGPDGQ